MKTERVPIASISADPANVRIHPERNLQAITASLRRFGQQKPIVVDGDGIVRAGNGTLAAAIALGWTEIEVVRTPLKGAEATAYAIADNRTGDLAEWSPQVSEQIEALVAELPDLDAEALGFLDIEIQDAFDAEPAEPPALSGDGGEFQQMTFVLHQDQVPRVVQAIEAAKKMLGKGEGNSNGHALFEIANAYCDGDAS